MDNSRPILRKAQKQDLPHVRQLVIDLAIYEKEPNAVTATLSDYEQAFDSDLIQIWVAESNGVIVGMVLFYLTFSTWKGKMMYLEDFYVIDEYRRRGVGKDLFFKFLEESKAQGCNLTKWQVLDWNEPAIAFYEKHHATIERNWWNCKISF